MFVYFGANRRRQYEAPSRRLAIKTAAHSGRVGTSVSVVVPGGLGGVTAVDSMTLLFAVFKSVTSEITLALSLMLPGVADEVFTVTVKLILAVESRVPNWQVKLAPFWLHGTDELTKLVWVGRVLVNTILVAACGPVFCTLRV